jgi:calcium-dependent protein kinase
MCVHRESSAQRAVKVLRKSHMDEDEKRMLFNEINILKEIDHPNIVKMYEFFEDEKRYYLVTEICKGGELFDEILQRGKFSERDGAVLMKQVLSCINYCHQNNIVHRDLKPENILLEQNKEFDAIKIIDFGTSLVYDPNKNLDEKLGTPYYIAPEVLNKNYNSKCDIWSCGVISYILLSGMPPFNGQSDQEIMKKVRAGSFSFDDKVWNNISDNCKDFITKLLTYKQEERPTAAEALQHPWIVELSTTVVDEKSAQDALSNLKSFKVDSSMKQATFAFIASQLLSKQERDGLAKVFKAFDKNGDGKLSYEEVKDGYLDHYGKVMSDEEVHAMFDSVDTDKSGFIDYSEFVVAAMAESQLTSNDKLQAAFKMFDKDGSGIISGDEIREVLSFGGTSQMSKEQIDTIIKQVDENGDGEISYEEFVDMMKKAFS